MLERKTSADGVITYSSPLLHAAGVPHTFSTRIGGISPRPFDTLNLGNPSGCAVQDQRERIRENYRRLQRAASCEDRHLCWVHQVHGDGVVRIEPGVAHDNDAKADALVTTDRQRVVSVRIADCVPVLLACDDGRTVAAVHAGWRGVVAGIVAAALREMTRDRSSRGRMIAAIGPSIAFDAFEVGAEVLDEFARAFGADAPMRRRDDGKGHVDLREAVRRQLVAAGVHRDLIDVTDRCTYRDADEFFSHRRDMGLTGRMSAIIGPRD